MFPVSVTVIYALLHYTLRATLKKYIQILKRGYRKVYSQVFLARYWESGVVQGKDGIMSKVVNQAPSAKSIDDQLAGHLLRAEESLIAALELFSKGKGPDRVPDYLKRLTRAQELVTTLMREELVRKRGPIRLKRR